MIVEIGHICLSLALFIAMVQAIAHIRQYLQPTPLSLNTTVPGMETGDFQDNLPASELPPFKQLLEEAERTERQSKQQEPQK